MGQFFATKLFRSFTLSPGECCCADVPGGVVSETAIALSPPPSPPLPPRSLSSDQHDWKRNVTPEERGAGGTPNTSHRFGGLTRVGAPSDAEAHGGDVDIPLVQPSAAGADGGVGVLAGDIFGVGVHYHNRQLGGEVDCRQQRTARLICISSWL